ncbi:uncharacterized protein LOC131623458 isoform X2 [Vicia villosa]|uniref:uncharacterized protein LOC131623458 isoform X2 n=1 Tax=Vicia villosa TaxID=3911 RepID=UPI00273AB1C7|nr:uncharacterized protein LOC131623458 isoform X2 [Vicia villosa]
MDLAEQSLQALKNISQEHPTACLRAGALMAVLSYLDFFSTGVQRVALSTAANMCKKLPSDAADFVMEAVPLLTNLLQYHDAKVISYRSGLVTAAASFVIAASAAYLPDNQDFFYVIGSGGLGLSLFLIHIYVTEIKRTLQALWGLGVLGSAATYIYLAQPTNKTLIQYVVDNPSAVWLVGPLFAALTGLVFKEGLCYGKLEAGALTFIIPILLLGHLVNRWLSSCGYKLWYEIRIFFGGPDDNEALAYGMNDIIIRR